MSEIREMPPTKPARDSLEDEIASMLVMIENNYRREGTGHGSRFEGERLEVVQARAAIRHVRLALCCSSRACCRVLVDRERELLDLKGHCHIFECRLHYAHSGPCDIQVVRP